MEKQEVKTFTTATQIDMEISNFYIAAPQVVGSSLRQTLNIGRAIQKEGAKNLAILKAQGKKKEAEDLQSNMDCNESCIHWLSVVLEQCDAVDAIVRLFRAVKPEVVPECNLKQTISRPINEEDLDPHGRT